MSDFTPSPAAAASALGIPIVTRKHPGGERGAKISLHEVARRIREGRLDPRVRGWASQQIDKAGRPKRLVDRAQAILDGLRKKAAYLPDPIGAEMIVAPHVTLCLDDTLCMIGADCDDLCVAFGSAAMSVGIPTHVVGQAFDGTRTPTHVICAVQNDWGDWLRVDPSHDRLPVGQAIHATWEITLDPLDDEDCGLAGKSAELVAGAGAAQGAAGDYVGVGSIPNGGTLQRTWTKTPLGWRHADRAVGIGTTILGVPSIYDLQKLLEAKDYELDQLGAHYATAAATWGLSDPTAYAAWGQDLQALTKRYNDAKALANVEIAAAKLNFLIPNTEIGAADAWNGILAAVHHDPEQAGDLTDLDRRLQHATDVATDYSKNPQPEKGMDADLNLYNAAGKALDAVGAPKDDFLKNLPWKKIGLIAGGALVTLIVVNKIVDKVL